MAFRAPWHIVYMAKPRVRSPMPS